MACIEKNGDIYCNPRCDLPKELQCKLYKIKLYSHSNFLAYPDHLKPDVLVKYESEYMNLVVYVVGTIYTIMMIGMYCISYSSAQGSLLVNSWTSLQNVKRTLR